MTSKISFLKLMQEDAKRRNWMLVFLTVLFFVCYPVLMMIGLDNIPDSPGFVLCTDFPDCGQGHRIRRAGRKME